MAYVVTKLIEDTLAQRRNVHGEFSDNSDVSQRLKSVIASGKNWEVMSSTQREALHMIAHKISRILAGDQNFLDHWHDLIGYARLVEKELEEGVVKS